MSTLVEVDKKLDSKLLPISYELEKRLLAFVSQLDGNDANLVVSANLAPLGDLDDMAEIDLDDTEMPEEDERLQPVEDAFEVGEKEPSTTNPSSTVQVPPDVPRDSFKAFHQAYDYQHELYLRAKETDTIGVLGTGTASHCASYSRPWKDFCWCLTDARLFIGLLNTLLRLPLV